MYDGSKVEAVAFGDLQTGQFCAAVVEFNSQAFWPGQGDPLTATRLSDFLDSTCAWKLGKVDQIFVTGNTEAERNQPAVSDSSVIWM